MDIYILKTLPRINDVVGDFCQMAAVDTDCIVVLCLSCVDKMKKR